jgi:hypothetical protein
MLVNLSGNTKASPVVSDLKNLLPGVPLVESPFFDEILPTCGFDAETQRIARDLNRDGFAVVRFTDVELEARADRIKRDLASHFNFEQWRAKDWPRGVGMRLFDTWKFNKDVAAFAANEGIRKILSDVFDRKAWPFQTLIFPVGSQQHYHSDSVHFSSIPEKFMCGVWLALEDVHDDAGPLAYYPGSHKWPILYNDQLGVRITGATQERNQRIYEPVWEALVAAHRIKPRYACPRKGEALIWLANLLHGGAPQRDPYRTRWSQVTHYYFEKCTYITPMLSDVLIGKLFVRDMVDISTRQPVPNIYLDVPLADIERLSKSVTLPADFDVKRYLELNPDVAASKVDGAEHYKLHGMREGRRYK